MIRKGSNIVKLILAICLQFLASSSGGAEARTIFCYWGTWAHYRPGDGKFEVANIDPQLCTHLGYTFLGITDTGAIKLLDSWLDVDLKNIENAIKLKQRNSNLKVIASVGGWNEGSAKYSAMAADSQRRATFISSTVALLLKFGFDGVDLDWEYPAQRGGGAADKQNYVRLLQELKAALKPHNKLLTVAVGAAQSSASQSYDIRGMSEHVDLINLMTYDFHGSWENVVGHNAPLQGSGELTVTAAVDYWLAQGAPASKLVLGLPFYGRTFTLANPSQTTVGSQSTGPGTAGPFTREQGILGYNEICLTLNAWKREWDSSALVPYAHKDNQWVGYDNEQSIVAKVNFIKAKGLAGAMTWSIETDDFLGKCGAKYPLLNAINQNLHYDDPVTDGPIRTSTTTTTTTTTRRPQQQPGCTEDGYHRHETDCARFFVCDFGVRYDFVCPDGLQFDLAVQVCNWPYAVNCNA